MTGRCIRRAMLLATLLAVAACGAAPPKPVPARALIAAAADVNPDASGRASPVVLRIYQLKEAGAFNDADFFALFEREQATLGAGLLAREEYALQPGEQRELEIEIAPEARFIGAVAAFRDIDNARWRAVSTAPEKTLRDLLRKSRVAVRVEQAAVSIAIGD